MTIYMRRAIHPTALIDENVHLGQNVTVGPNAIIHSNVQVGDGSFIGPNAILGEPSRNYFTSADYTDAPLKIGANAIIRAGTIVYSGSEIGDNFECGARVHIREASKIGRNVSIGTVSDLQGYCEIGDYTRLHSNVHIGQKSRIGKFVWIFPYVVLTNDPTPPSHTMLGVTIEDFAIVATMAVVLPGVRIGKDSLVGAKALVRSDVAPETVVVGVPAKTVGRITDIKVRGTDESQYPWRYRFDRGMPWEGIPYDEWEASQDPDSGK